jgi:hypothetical protein
VTAFFYQLLAGRVQLLVEEGHGHIEAVDGQADHTRLDMLPISTAGQEREAPGVVCHNHAGQAHKLQLGGGSVGLQDNNQVERLVNNLVATKALVGVIILVIPISANEVGQQF